MPETVDPKIEKIRAFNRFYTQRVGVIQHLEGNLSLPAARVLFEVALHSDISPVGGGEIAQALDLDPGYVSRLLNQLERKGFIEKRPSSEDGRRRELRMMQAGQRCHDELTERTRSELSGLLAPLDPDQQDRLIGCMDTIQGLLKPEGPIQKPCVLREHRSGDLGWVVYRHGVLYRQHPGFNEKFEALVASIVADFGERNNPRHDRLWIAEQGGEKVGSIMLVKERDDISRLRLFLVEPSARGLGLGRQLIDTCLAFSRSVGYRSVVLSTVRELAAARHLYQSYGFELVQHDTEPHRKWGPAVHNEEWRLDFDTTA